MTKVNKILAYSLSSCNDTFEKVNQADVDINILKKETGLKEIECKIIVSQSKSVDTKLLQASNSFGVEFDSELFLRLLNNTLDKKTEKENVKNKNVEGYKVKVYKEYIKEDLEKLGHINKEDMSFYFKKPNLGENRLIKQESLISGKIDFELLAMNFLIYCAYYEDENGIKKKVYTPKHLEQLKAGEPNNPYIPTALKHWIKFTLETSYLGLEGK